MPANNGDMSRFHWERKQKIARRQRTHKLLMRYVTVRKSVGVSARKPQPVSA